MSDPCNKLPRTNPFWSYRDPSTGRWLTLMTAAQWQQASPERPFAPRQQGVDDRDRPAEVFYQPPWGFS